MEGDQILTYLGFVGRMENFSICIEDSHGLDVIPRFDVGEDLVDCGRMPKFHRRVNACENAFRENV